MLSLYDPQDANRPVHVLGANVGARWTSGVTGTASVNGNNEGVRVGSGNSRPEEVLWKVGGEERGAGIRVGDARTENEVTWLWWVRRRRRRCVGIDIRRHEYRIFY